jgi:hypothetical protein
MYSAVFRSLTSSDAQVDIFRDNERCLKWDTIARTVQKPELTVRGWVNPHGKQKPDDQIPEPRGNQLQSSHCFRTIRKGRVFVNGSLTASTKVSTQVPWRLAGLRHVYEKNGRIAISSVLGTGGPVPRTDFPTLRENSWQPWKAHGVRSQPRK